MVRIELVMLAGSVLLLLAIFASKVSSRVGIPAMLLFLVVGMLAGSEGPGGGLSFHLSMPPPYLRYSGPATPICGGN